MGHRLAVLYSILLASAAGGAPDAAPALLAEGVISTVDDEAGGCPGPDADDFTFARFVPYTTYPRIGILLVSHRRDGRWSAPEVLPFSGTYLDFPARFDPSGKRMLFASSRPLPDGVRGFVRIWEVERAGNSWGEPRPLPPPVNAPGVTWNGDPSVTRDGTLYFSSDRDGSGAVHIYRSRFTGGHYAEPEKLGTEVNSPWNEAQPFVSPDETILVFNATGEGGPPNHHRAEELGGGGKPYPRGDLYVSVGKNGAWTPARHLGHGINTEFEESFPCLSADGKTLFFSSERSPFSVPAARRLDYRELEKNLHSTFNGHGNIFSMGVESLELSR
jgi:Tol biopolymer transport system component